MIELTFLAFINVFTIFQAGITRIKQPAAPINLIKTINIIISITITDSYKFTAGR
ncbi:hypothetical protein HMPREF9370_1774 [Neisseria wadsworthii 9715]|uniref:Uncharacterized protein n=1 Tax=Neisseria wadsworthii 9715 TaxID=1030841 RepID=G4CRR4_9NEIS|nr:hypothetical protein HMPREF9370_1774 [Neisseria wadsworthii 9715]